MKNTAKVLVYLAAASIVVGLGVKVLGIDFSSMGVSTQFPIKPQSFLNFANSILLFSIALILLDKKDKS